MARISDSERSARQKGKKIAVHRSTACEGVVNMLDIRLTDNDRFTAEFLGTWYEAETIVELKKALDDEVKKQGPTAWEYFIEVDDVDFDDEKDRPRYWNSREKIEIKVDYRVIKLSNVITPTGVEFIRGHYRDEAEPYRLLMVVYVEKDGKLRDDTDQRKVAAGTPVGKTRIPYTEARWAALDAIRAAARELGRRLAEALNGDSDKVVAFLGGMPLAILALPAAPEVIPPKKKASRS